MYRKFIEKYYVWIGVILFFISYIIFYPANFMITDAYSYASQAIAIAQGKTTLTSFDFLTGETINLIKAPYSPGTAFYYALFVKILGKSGIFYGSLFSVIATSIFLYYSLKNKKLQTYSITLLFVSPPLLFYSRSLMSCMSSLLIISICLWIFSLKKHNFTSFIFLGFFTGLSIWFRETNIILLAPLCIYIIYKNIFQLIPISIGFIIGISIKIISSWIIYGKPWFISASAGFDINNIFNHGTIYLFIGMLLFPIGFLLILFYAGKADRSIKVGVFLFVFVYILYNYTAVPFSGFLKGTLLTSRFLIPLLPFMVLGLAHGIKRYKLLEKTAIYLVVPLSLIMIPLSLYSFNHLYGPHQNAAKKINQITANAPIIYDQTGYTNTIRYINPLTHNMSAISDIQNLRDPQLQNISKQKNAFIVLSMSTENEEKYDRTHEKLFYIDGLDLLLVEKIEIDESNWIDIYQFNK